MLWHLNWYGVQNMNNDLCYSFTQISEREFKYDLGLSNKNIISDWIEENLEAEDYLFYDTVFGTHAYTVYVRFFETENAVAFKLRWAN